MCTGRNDRIYSINLPADPYWDENGNLNDSPFNPYNPEWMFVICINHAANTAYRYSLDASWPEAAIEYGVQTWQGMTFGGVTNLDATRQDTLHTKQDHWDCVGDPLNVVVQTGRFCDKRNAFDQTTTECFMVCINTENTENT